MTGLDLGRCRTGVVELSSTATSCSRSRSATCTPPGRRPATASSVCSRTPGAPSRSGCHTSRRRAPMRTVSTFDPDAAAVGPAPAVRLGRRRQAGAAILREEGSNGDRELAAAFLAAGFEPWDVTMTDLLAGGVGLRGFQLVAFVGGFSFG